MRLKLTLLPVLLLAISVLPVFAGSGGRCSPEGTWYGGSTTKYVLTISPKSGNSYSVTAQGAYSLGITGVVAHTSYSGEMIKIAPKTYLMRMISLLSYDSALPPAESAIEIDATSGPTVMTSCSTMTGTIDYFVAYFGWGAEPFVDSPDLDLLAVLNGGEPIVETYRRISMAPMN